MSEERTARNRLAGDSGDFDQTLNQLMQGPATPTAYDLYLHDHAARPGEAWADRTTRYLAEFAREAPRHAIPGYARGEDAYRAYQQGDLPGAAWQAGMGALEVGAPVVFGRLAREAGRGRVGYGPKDGDAFEAAKATGINATLPSGVAPALWGIGARANNPLAPRKGWGRGTPEDVLAAATPRSTKGVSLSKNIMGPSAFPEAGTGFHYLIYDEGKLIGYAAGRVTGSKAYITWIGDTNVQRGANTIGVAGVRQLREALRQDFPDVKVFEGTRVSGARRGDAAKPGVNPRQRVRMDEWLLPTAISAGGVLRNALSGPENEPY